MNDLAFAAQDSSVDPNHYSALIPIHEMGHRWLVRWSASGLETGLSATLALGVILSAMRARERDAAPWGAAVLAGLAPGERIVASANFLVDAESRLATTGGGMPGMQHGAVEPAPAAPPATEHRHD